MGEDQVIKVLLVEDNLEFAKLVTLFLDRFDGGKFSVTWKQRAAEAVDELSRGETYDVVLMDYFLPGMNGLEATRALREKNIAAAIIFLTVNKDMNLAVEAMKLGVEDYLVKEEISTPILPKTLMSVVERRRLQKEMEELEIRKRRLEAMQELIVTIASELGTPLATMQQKIQELRGIMKDPKMSRYLGIISDNVQRINSKMEKLKNLEEDKTVQYIKNIKMIDLS
jgi:sigma-B regulation protein RsbU (phosphoserine phosphatase)